MDRLESFSVHGPLTARGARVGWRAGATDDRGDGGHVLAGLVRRMDDLASAFAASSDIDDREALGCDMTECWAEIRRHMEVK